MTGAICIVVDWLSLNWILFFVSSNWFDSEMDAKVLRASLNDGRQIPVLGLGTWAGDWGDSLGVSAAQVVSSSICVWFDSRIWNFPFLKIAEVRQNADNSCSERCHRHWLSSFRHRLLLRHGIRAGWSSQCQNRGGGHQTVSSKFPIWPLLTKTAFQRGCFHHDKNME